MVFGYFIINFLITLVIMIYSPILQATVNRVVADGKIENREKAITLSISGLLIVGTLVMVPTLLIAVIKAIYGSIKNNVY